LLLLLLLDSTGAKLGGAVGAAVAGEKEWAVARYWVHADHRGLALLAPDLPARTR
jgi:hypothetical protein